MAPDTIADLATARTVIAELQDALGRAERENTVLRQKLDVLCHKLFGKKSEGVSDAQLRLAFAQLAEELKPRDEPTEMDTGERPGPQHRRALRPTGRRPLPASLPRHRCWAAASAACCASAVSRLLSACPASAGLKAFRKTLASIVYGRAMLTAHLREQVGTGLASRPTLRDFSPQTGQFVPGRGGRLGSGNRRN